MSDQPTWVNNPDDPREKMRLALAEEFMVKHGTTILYDFGATVVGWICTQPELVDRAIAEQARERERWLGLSAPTPEEHRAP